ncbi:hypothetical protein PAAG_02976 [Paracoccidioides lutzii Pb01]|uniref:Serine hydrolase domain-containing protein n=1 Tax=Paracoccidioides lutzii (strain ATCC MYA-826 / Pb01) TaxID=502779 RepID=C1GY22_PARBA|nr:hypothetical protein PAAG_02976 [Paracoccidioides lutzii Pb01]EEH41413.2 hypothetical protein PAAG_02976 [Paracoccidioides lutzii Pb01]
MTLHLDIPSAAEYVCVERRCSATRENSNGIQHSESLCDNLESDGTASFHFAQGNIPARPPPGFEDYFGPPPHFQFFDNDAAEEDLRALRDFIKRDVAEESMQILEKRLLVHIERRHDTLRPVLDRIIQIMDKEGDIEGVVGYSEGALIGASLILEEQRRYEELGRPVGIKCAVFLSGWPPFDPKTGKLLLSDGGSELIKIHTCHVLGANDPFIDGCMALYNICDPDTANIFDHGHGHTVPQGDKIQGELAEVIREMVAEAQQES